jgi:hypothetical protein
MSITSADDAYPDTPDPPALLQLRAQVAKLVPEATEIYDRRGFKMQHWSSPRTARKPIELSLEYEARLQPRVAGTAEPLLTALTKSENRPLKEQILPNDIDFGDLRVRAYARPPGPQSIDLYYDATNDGRACSLIARQVTIRERLSGQSLMTWSNGDDGLLALNLELPFIPIGSSGLIARLEFNWLDNVNASLQEATSSTTDLLLRTRNPFHLAMMFLGCRFSSLVPAAVHITTRKKFDLYLPGASKSEQDVVFVINIDSINAKDQNGVLSKVCYLRGMR